MTMDRAVKAALIGYGYASKAFHAPLLTNVPGILLTTVVSSDPCKVKSVLPDVQVVSTPEDAFLASDLVVIATPNTSHFDLAHRALMAGKHVVVDKPFTITSVEACELIGLAAKSKRLLSVFHNRRWDSDFLTLRKLMADGKLGNVVHYESHFDRYRPQVGHRWRELAAPGSGIWYDLGPHLLDQAFQLFGLPQAIFADLAMQREGAVAVDYFHVLLRYPGTRALLHGGNLVSGGMPRFAVHGTIASYIKYGLDPQEDAMNAGHQPGTVGWGVDQQDGTLYNGASKAQETVATVPGNYLEYYAQVRDAILHGAPNPVPAEDALAVTQALELGVESSKTRNELAFAGHPGVLHTATQRV